MTGPINLTDRRCPVKGGRPALAAVSLSRQHSGHRLDRPALLSCTARDLGHHTGGRRSRPPGTIGRFTAESSWLASKILAGIVPPPGRQEAPDDYYAAAAAGRGWAGAGRIGRGPRPGGPGHRRHARDWRGHLPS